MKKMLLLLIVMMLILPLFSASAGDAGYYTYVLFDIEENGTVYRAYGNTGITFRFYEDWTMKSYGLRLDDEEDPAQSWKFNDDRTAITMTIRGQEYTMSLADNIMTLEAEGRKLHFRQKHQAEEAAKEPAEHMTIPSESLSGCFEAVCPVTFDRWREQKISYRLDGNACYRFTTDYGPFMYVINTVTGEIIEKEEADIDEARAREGFREQLSSDEIYDIIFSVCPVERSKTDKISRSSAPDGTWNITISTVYGDFFYNVDAYTGEILDKVEPDIEEARTQEGVVEPISSEEALDIAEKACPLEPGKITKRKVSKSDTGFVVTLGSNAGDFVYRIDRATGEIVEKTEPEIVEEPVQTDTHALTDSGEGLDLAEEAFPLERDKITSRKVSRGSGDIWTVTLGTVYGDFVYLIDPATGEIIEKQEPDIEAARNEEGFREPLSDHEILKIAEEASGQKPGFITSRKLAHKKDNTWEITLGTAQGDYFFVIDGYTGEIKDSVVPEGGAPTEQEKDPFEAAIDTAFASLEGFDYKAENIRVAQTKVDGKDAIKVNFVWQGKEYEMYYSVADKTLINAQ